MSMVSCLNPEVFHVHLMVIPASCGHHCPRALLPQHRRRLGRGPVGEGLEHGCACSCCSQQAQEDKA
jgi:hypothetical protein